MRVSLPGSMRGYCGIGIFDVKTDVNIGTLWRSAFAMGASHIFAIGKRYKAQASDTVKAHRHIPFFEYLTFEDFYEHIPKEARLVGIEIIPTAIELQKYKHPEQAVYLLGAEDYGLPERILAKCHEVVSIPSTYCLNVAVAGSIVLYDRILKHVRLDAPSVAQGREKRGLK